MPQTIKARLRQLRKNANIVNVLVDVTPALTLVGVRVIKVREDYAVFSNGVTNTAIPFRKIKDVVF